MKNQRHVSFEFARIIACFTVICLHTSSWYISGSSVNKNLLFIKAFLQDAVPIFWYIMGFFLFANPSRPFSKLLRKTFYKVFLPAFGAMLFAQLFSPWLSGKESLEFCLQNFSIDFYNLFGNLFQWKASMTLMAIFGIFFLT